MLDQYFPVPYLEENEVQWNTTTGDPSKRCGRDTQRHTVEPLLRGQLSKSRNYCPRKIL